MKEIIQNGDKVLRCIASVVSDTEIKTLRIQEVLHTMQESLAQEEDGVALAAPQIGEILRIFIVSGMVFGEEMEDRVFINPELVSVSNEREFIHEGCLSVRHIYGNVERHNKATVRAYDKNGKKFTLGASGLLAQIFQHEIDHLNGILFIDKAIELQKMNTDESTESLAIKKNEE